MGVEFVAASAINPEVSFAALSHTVELTLFIRSCGSFQWLAEAADNLGFSGCWLPACCSATWQRLIFSVQNTASRRSHKRSRRGTPFDRCCDNSKRFRADKFHSMMMPFHCQDVQTFAIHPHLLSLRGSRSSGDFTCLSLSGRRRGQCVPHSGVEFEFNLLINSLR